MHLLTKNRLMSTPTLGIHFPVLSTLLLNISSGSQGPQELFAQVMLRYFVLNNSLKLAKYGTMLF